ncbi:MAG: helix-turn-helix domain-containing protein [Alphaproteobacteria bacterium]
MQQLSLILPERKDIKAARYYMDWSQSDLAKNSGVSASAINNIETNKTKPNQKSLEKIAKTFWNEGITFHPEGGFKASQKLIKVLEEASGIEEFFLDVAATAQLLGGEFYAIGIEEGEFQEKLREANVFDIYVKKMENTQNFTLKMFTNKTYEEKQSNFSYIQTKQVPEELFISLPIYVYDDKVGIILWHNNKIIVMKDQLLADSYRKQLSVLWDTHLE